MNVKKNIKHDEAGIIKLIEAARSIESESYRAMIITSLGQTVQKEAKSQ